MAKIFEIHPYHVHTVNFFLYHCLITSRSVFAFVLSIPDSRCSGPASERCDRQQRSLCKNIPVTGQEEEVSDQGAPEESEPSVQRDVHL